MTGVAVVNGGKAASLHPTRTVRVELAVGNRQVSAAIDARDEARLL